jgi:hypothetical protein
MSKLTQVLIAKRSLARINAVAFGYGVLSCPAVLDSD